MKRESPVLEAAELETATLQDRIDDAWRRGGGIVEVESGVHRIGSIRLRSNVTLLLRSGAVLQASRNLADYDGWANDALEPVERPKPGDPVAGFGNSNVHVCDCDISSACSAFRFGGRHVLVENCVVHGPCDFPFRGSLPDAVKKCGGEGAPEEGRHNMLSLFTYFSMSGYGLRENAGDVVLRNIRVSGADRFLQYNYSGNEVWSTGVPMDGITFENVTATGLKFPLCAYGDATVPLSLALRNCRLSFAMDQNELVRGANLKIDLSDVEVEGVEGVVLRNYGSAAEIKATGLKGVRPLACQAEEPFAVEAI